MKKLQSTATSLGMGIGLVYLIFLWEPIYTLFPEAFIVLLRQVLVLAFGLCVLINPQGIVQMAEKVAPKIITLLSVIFVNKNKKDDTME